MVRGDRLRHEQTACTPPAFAPDLSSIYGGTIWEATMAEFPLQHLRNNLWRKQQRRAAEATVNPILMIDPALAAELDLEAIANASPAVPATSTIQAQTGEPEIGLEGEPVRETTPQDAEPGEVDLSPTFILRAMAPDKLAGFVQVPWSLIDSGVIGALPGVAPRRASAPDGAAGPRGKGELAHPVPRVRDQQARHPGPASAAADEALGLAGGRHPGHHPGVAPAA